jgi:E3 ubiquitin-protein ligase UBR4
MKCIYMQACTLKRIQKHPPEGDTFSTSDSTTYYEDDFSCSDGSSADDGKLKVPYSV